MGKRLSIKPWKLASAGIILCFAQTGINYMGGDPETYSNAGLLSMVGVILLVCAVISGIMHGIWGRKNKDSKIHNDRS